VDGSTASPEVWPDGSATAVLLAQFQTEMSLHWMRTGGQCEEAEKGCRCTRSERASLLGVVGIDPGTTVGLSCSGRMRRTLGLGNAKNLFSFRCSLAIDLSLEDRMILVCFLFI
jgi:hypothetical protein